MSRESIRARLAAVTGASWRVAGGTVYLDEVVVLREHRDEQGRRCTTFLAQMFECASPDAGVVPKANGEFIAHARQDVPALLALADAVAHALSPDAVGIGNAIDARQQLEEALAALEALP